MAYDTVPTFAPSAFGSSRPQICHPWHDLVRATFSLYEGKDVELPSQQSAVAEQDPEKRVLYKLALGHFQNAHAEMQRPKFDKASCTDFKDAFVALSGVWNVFSKEANEAFPSADLQEVEELCRMTELENKDADVMEILNMLAEKSREAPLTDVVNEICILLSTKPERRPFLMVLLAVLRHVIRPHYGSMAPSEADSLYLWARIFDDGMPLNTHFSFHLLEVGNIEAKRISAPKLEVMFQLRKNIKINKSLLLQLEKYGVECPPLLSIHGNIAIIFRVRRWKGIFVASKACPTLVLPTTEDEWPLFLSRHAYVLSNLLPKLSKKVSCKPPDNTLLWKKIEQVANDREDEDDCEGQCEAAEAALGTPTSRLSQTQPMFENDDMINIVEDCLQNILVPVSPLIRSVLITVIEHDAEVKEKIGPILK
ncbi:hypothetical protein BGZ65_007981 [Modicella reniformis]|uniref:Uncharacterized protein n=1 Tax=Modicella reniformis TaxID=1440133 RepID=A0A9P6IUL9_9FUNG|nr:hypothetical protein BGZ65_007981 [Modicella reniformis]